MSQDHIWILGAYPEINQLLLWGKDRTFISRINPIASKQGNVWCEIVR